MASQKAKMRRATENEVEVGTGTDHLDLICYDVDDED